MQCSPHESRPIERPCRACLQYLHQSLKYNHLVANCLIFDNLCSLTRLVQHLEQRGEIVSEDAIAAISPYLTEHINRFGDYTLNLGRKPPNPTTVTPSGGPHQSHETKWPILYRIVAIPRVVSVIGLSAQGIE
jgi:hypothetical protein